MILLINICKEKLHYYEFVNPIKNILKKQKIKFFVKNYLDIAKKDLNKADKIIICGTSLKDSEFIRNIEKFNWIKSIDKPLLGICGGMQIIGLIFGSKLKNKTEIGYYNEVFNKNFLGLKGNCEVYHLHKNYISVPKDFERYGVFDIPQAIKYKNKEIYGTLFHPEVRNSLIILNFAKKVKK